MLSPDTSPGPKKDVRGDGNPSRRRFGLSALPGAPARYWYGAGSLAKGTGPTVES